MTIIAGRRRTEAVAFARMKVPRSHFLNRDVFSPVGGDSINSASRHFNDETASVPIKLNSQQIDTIVG
jgi:hypothetical protein